MNKIRNSIKKIVCVFLIGITIAKLPVFAARTTYNDEKTSIRKVEATTRSGVGTTDTKKACLHYAKKIMGHNPLMLKSKQKANNVEAWRGIVSREIRNKRPILLYGRNTKTQNRNHWILAYGFGFGDAKKFYNTLWIIDPYSENGDYKSVISKNYIFSMDYIKVDGEHFGNSNAKRDQVVAFAKKYSGMTATEILSSIKRKYGNDSFWARSGYFGGNLDWCNIFVSYVYNRCGLNPYVVSTPNGFGDDKVKFCADLARDADKKRKI